MLTLAEQTCSRLCYTAKLHAGTERFGFAGGRLQACGTVAAAVQVCPAAAGGVLIAPVAAVTYGIWIFFGSLGGTHTPFMPAS